MSQRPPGLLALHPTWRLILILSGSTIGCGAGAPSPTGSDAGIAAPSLAIASQANAEYPAAPDPTLHEPVTATMVARPERISAGETADLLVSVRIAPGHYVHAASDADTTFAPVTVDVELPEAVEAVGAWEFPSPQSAKNGEHVYRDSLLLRRTLKVPADALPRTHQLTGRVRYQVCNEELCWPLATIEATARLEILIPAR